MAVTYSKTSLYSTTPIFQGKYLDIMVPREIPKEADDIIFTITPAYNLRPDNLAYDLYGEANLWWVFMMRNKNTLVDPIWDFTTGTTIFLPKKVTLQTVLAG